jgi:dihydrofolate reductase
MRKLKLQMQITVDGFVAGPEGQLDWMTWDMDNKIVAFINQLTDTSDTILLGRKMAGGFLNYWEGVVKQPKSPEYSFARKMVDIPKIVFTKTLDSIDGQNVRIEKGDLTGAIDQLKKAPGKDIVVYGGATFVSSLLENSLIDELHFFVNPVGIGNGMRVFKSRKPMTLTSSVSYPCGIVVNSYKLKAA